MAPSVVLLVQSPGGVAVRLLRGFWALVCLIFLLAIVATVPVLQVVVLGYLMEVSGRIAREGRLNAAWVGWQEAAQWGTALLGTALVAGLWFALLEQQYAAYLVNVEGPEPGATSAASLVLGGLLLVHLVTAWFAGARWAHFLWPVWFPWVVVRLGWGRRPASEWFPPAIFWRAVREGTLLSQAADGLWQRLAALRLPYLFWLGLRGLIATVMWLVVPVILMAAAFDRRGPAAGLLGLLGGIGYGLVILYLPFLQTSFAATGRWSDMFRIGRVRAAYRAAPVAMVFAWLVTFALSIPLYLLKIEYTPREIAWLPALVFVTFALPGRWITGWAWGRALRRGAPRHFLLRWIAGGVLLAAAAVYTGLVFLTQYTSWYGTWSLLEQHAVLLPIPFWGGP